MQVESIEGLTKDDIGTLIDYIELTNKVIESLPGGDVALGRALLVKPELFIKLAKFVVG